MSAIYSPEIDENGRLTDLMIYGYTQKIRTMFRIALSNGHNAIVLGAWGCGDAGTPPEQLAEIFRKILTEDEFRNKFSKVVFAVFMNDLALNAFEKTFGTRKNDLFINYRKFIDANAIFFQYNRSVNGIRGNLYLC